MNLLTQFMFEADDFNELPLQTKILLIAFYIVPAVAITFSTLIKLKGMF